MEALIKVILRLLNVHQLRNCLVVTCASSTVFSLSQNTVDDTNMTVTIFIASFCFSFRSFR
jgi:4-hydroxybenzoate polyprenyltransferase